MSLSQNGSIVAIGARDNGDAGQDAGHVRVYDLSPLILSKEDVLSSTIALFPNPSQNSISIRLTDTDVFNEVNIYNKLGQKVLNNTTTEIDISSLSSGVYLVHVITNDGIFVKKMTVK